MDPRVEIIVADITGLAVDAIVNAANTTLLGGGGVDGAIHRKAGKDLVEYCRTLGGCRVGEAKITPGFNLPARHVIHTVGPFWSGGGRNEAAVLADCYRNALAVAAEHRLKTVAFPAISTGAYRFPPELAAEIAVGTLLEVLEDDDRFERVILCCFSEPSADLHRQALAKAG